MPFKITGRVEGVGEVMRALDGVNKRLAKKLTRAAASAAGKVVLWAARERVPVRTKLLKRSLGRKVKVYGNTAVAVVGPRVGFREEVVRGGRQMISDPVKYAHLVEHGTAPHGYKTGAGSHPGAAAKPFLAPAVEGKQAEIRDAMARAIADGLAKAGEA